MGPTIMVVLFWVGIGKLAGWLVGPAPSGPPLKRAALTPELRSSVMRRDGYRCTRCGSDWLLEIDHIKPWSLGGLDDPTNLQTLCRRCNRAKSNRFVG
jgi:5-methylcytosine-specific restriction endonuclease McrA